MTTLPRRLATIAVLFVFASFSGCAATKKIFDDTPPGVHATVQIITAEYIQTIIAGRTDALESMIYWNKFIKNDRGRISKEQVLAQVRKLQNRWELERHPLYGLRVIDVDTSNNGNSATVTLQKDKNPKGAEIEVFWEWAGTGWVVVDDSILGIHGLMASYAGANQGRS